MAVYIPATTFAKAHEICHILRSEERDDFTIYIIEISIQPYKWQVARRYKQFVELHDAMVKYYAINKSLLPPKKLLGNRSEAFITERQKALELYLQTLINQFTLLPQQLAIFLDFQKYEIRSITATLSEKLFHEGEEIITSKNTYQFTPLHLYAVTERLKLGEPTCYYSNLNQDFAHLVEFITCLKNLKILGNDATFEASNIVFNNLSFDLSMFKSLESLEMINCNPKRNLLSVDALRPRLKSLVLHKSLKNLSDILLCEILHWSSITDPVESWPYWQNITYVNFSHNSLNKITASIKLLRAAKHIDLSYNEIEVIENMESLSELSILILSHNKIKDLESSHTRLGNIQHLDLSSNRILSLYGLSKLFSICKLYLDNNFIASLSEISYLTKMPCLEVLNLQNNPVTFLSDYRTQLLLLFRIRASEIIFDGLRATEKEIDTVSVLHALKQARTEPESPNIQQRIYETVSDGLTETYSDSGNAMPPVSYGKIKGETSTTKIFQTSNIQTSKFRQQVEALRKIGGSDWLRLLNDMHSQSSTVIDELTYDCPQNIESSNINQDENNLLSQDFTISFEMSYPEWIWFHDSNNDQFLKQVLNIFLQERGESCSTSSLIKIVWGIILKNFENSMQEIPICILLLKTEVVFLKLNSLVSQSQDKTIFPKMHPELSFLKSINSSSVISLSIGPCYSYVELKAKLEEASENFIILFQNQEIALNFVDECQNLYKIKSLCKLDPFSNKTLEFESVNTDVSSNKAAIEKQIIFGQRVCVSKVFHKVQRGVLHYVFITPSHIVLIEERLGCHDLIDFDVNVRPQFEICNAINIHTNIKQVHLKDIDDEIVSESNATHLSCIQDKKKEDLLCSQSLDFLYKCGFWLMMEFESGVLLCLNFLTLNQRNEFLNAFLCVRNLK